MAKQRRKKAADSSAFEEGAKVDGLEGQVEKAASSVGAKSKAKGVGDNSSGITDDELKRLIEASAAAVKDVEAAQLILDKAKGVYDKSLDVLKSRAGASLKDSVKKYFKDKKARKTEGDGILVTEQRNQARIMRVMQDPLYTQWSLWDVDADTTGTKAERVVPEGMDAELQGQHAAHNQEPLENNPFIQGTEEFVAFEAGWNNAMAAQQPTGSGEAQATH